MKRRKLGEGVGTYVWVVLKLGMGGRDRNRLGKEHADALTLQHHPATLKQITFDKKIEVRLMSD
jgi:hypothetical protein